MSKAEPAFAHTLVVGAGAIGSLYAARLSSHVAVTLLVRSEEAADAIRRNGLRMVGREQTTTVVDASTRVDRIEPGTLVLLTTKAQDGAAALAPLVPLLRDDTVVLCVQNGLYSERAAAGVVGDRCAVLRAITNFGAIFVEPGVVDYRWAAETLVEPGPRAEAVATLLSEAGLEGRVTPRLHYEMWRKLVLNCVVNPITALTGMEVGWIIETGLNPLKQAIIDECLAVARADGLRTDEDFLAVVNAAYVGNHNQSSTLQDLRRGRTTEIDFLNGGVAKLGREYGIECPVNQGLADLVRQLEIRARASR